MCTVEAEAVCAPAGSCDVLSAPGLPSWWVRHDCFSIFSSNSPSYKQFFLSYLSPRLLVTWRRLYRGFAYKAHVRILHIKCFCKMSAVTHRTTWCDGVWGPTVQSTHQRRFTSSTTSLVSGLIRFLTFKWRIHGWVSSCMCYQCRLCQALAY